MLSIVHHSHSQSFHYLVINVIEFALPAVVLEVGGLDGLLGQEVADPLVGVDPGPADGALVALRLVGAS